MQTKVHTKIAYHIKQCRLTFLLAAAVQKGFIICDIWRNKIHDEVCSTYLRCDYVQA